MFNTQYINRLEDFLSSSRLTNETDYMYCIRLRNDIIDYYNHTLPRKYDLDYLAKQLFDITRNEDELDSDFIDRILKQEESLSSTSIIGWIKTSD